MASIDPMLKVGVPSTGDICVERIWMVFLRGATVTFSMTCIACGEHHYVAVPDCFDWTPNKQGEYL
jgi:hypothetical protein